MKNKILICATLFLTVFTSCNNFRLKQEAKSQTTQFFKCLKDNDTGQILQMYPGFGIFHNYYKSNIATIKSVVVNNDVVKVSVHSKYENPLESSDKDILLFFKKDKANKLSIFDSKGLANWGDDQSYPFAVATGCIYKNFDTTDQQIITGFRKARKIIVNETANLKEELAYKVRIVSFAWETTFSGSASGHGIVINNSDYNFPVLKYQITYSDRNGNKVTTDDGYLSYEPVVPGERKAFTFFSSYIANATKASIEPLFDDDLIEEYLLKKQWTGSECNAYFTAHPEEMNDL